MKKALDTRISTALVATLSLAVSSVMTGSLIIGIAFATLSAAAIWRYFKQRAEIKRGQLSQVWPEIIDHLISGLYSGLSISEALSDLAHRGPEITRDDFAIFNKELRSGVEFADAINHLRIKFSHHGSDQIFEALLLSKTLGGGELLNTLRTLGSFQREDLALHKEISIKHGWIKNSAHISSAAPWLLLLIIGTQPGTAKAFGSSTGIAILASGVAMTFLAYLWMSRIARLPETPRVFTGTGIG